VGNSSLRKPYAVLPLLVALGIGTLDARPAAAQNPEIQQKVAEIKEAAAKNKQALAQYTWVEQVTISLKGEEKKQEHFQVRVGPDGKNQKTSLDPAAPAADSGGGRGGRLKSRIVDKKKEEYKEYADQIKALIQQYVPPDREYYDGARPGRSWKLSPGDRELHQKRRQHDFDDRQDSKKARESFDRDVSG
jgi:hypothetical protein